MIVITGASSGIGLEVAKLYHQAGKKVVNISLEESSAAEVNIVCNLREGKAIKQAASEVLELKQPIEAIINCVGIYSRQKIGYITEDEVKKLMATNVKAPLMLISELLDSIKANSSDILNVVSTAGTPSNFDSPLYATSKWAERGFTLNLQHLLKDTGSRVISFCPGGIDTDLVKKAGEETDTSGWMKPDAIAKFIKQILDLPKDMEVSEVIINRKAVI